MAVRIDRPSAGPSWLESVLASADRILTRLSREKVGRLRRDFGFADAGQILSLGALPANAVIDKSSSGVFVHEAFNAGTDNRLDIGTAADPDFYAADVPLTALGFVAIGAAGISLRPSETQATELTCSVDLSGTAATAGRGSVIVAYMLL